MFGQQPSLVVSKPKSRHWVIGATSGVIALASLVIGSAWGQVHAKAVDPQVVAWASAFALGLFGTIGTTLVSSNFGRIITGRSFPSAGAAVRIAVAGIGYLVVLFGVFAVLNVSIEKLLLGAGVAAVVLGIAATQSLGNVFAGVVIIFARPFSVGDHIRIRSGALGGVFDGWVMEMSLTYTTLRLDDGQWKIPNGALLAAGVGQLPRTLRVPPLPQVPAVQPPSVTAAGPASEADTGGAVPWGLEVETPAKPRQTVTKLLQRAAPTLRRSLSNRRRSVNARIKKRAKPGNRNEDPRASTSAQRGSRGLLDAQFGWLRQRCAEVVLDAAVRPFDGVAFYAVLTLVASCMGGGGKASLCGSASSK